LFERAWLPLPVFVIAMVLLRSSLAGFGHYAIHRAQKGMNKVYANAFDFNYVALALVTADGMPCSIIRIPRVKSISRRTSSP